MRLINTSMSSRGWSFYQKDAHCPALPFALGKTWQPRQSASSNQKETSDESQPLTVGSMGHILQAHHLARKGTAEGGCLVAGEWSENPDDWLPPVDALDEWLKDNDGAAYRDNVLSMFSRYLATYGNEIGEKVLAVETEHFGVVGLKAGRWGYWTIQPDFAHYLRQPVSTHPPQGLPCINGGFVVCEPLNVPGHFEHGFPVWMSRRSDADIQQSAGRIVIRDHKHKGSVSTARKLDEEYRQEAGFCAFRILGSHTYGKDFNGVELQAVQTKPPYNVVRTRLTPTPARDKNFANLLLRWATDRAQREVDDPTGESYKGWRGSSSACIDRWGKPCPGTFFCYGVGGND